jgi:hypothetical protein
MNDGMSMGPPPQGDPFGLVVVVVGALATVWTIVFAVRASIWPGETDPEHPKYLIFKDDR